MGLLSTTELEFLAPNRQVVSFTPHFWFGNCKRSRLVAVSISTRFGLCHGQSHGLIRRAFAVCALFVFVLLSGGSSRAAEPVPSGGWPQWRGPTFDGISLDTNLVESWPESGPPVLWTREIGRGYSSLIAVGPHVFTQTQSLYEQAVVCLDADTGKTIWSTRYGWAYDGGGLYPGPRSTPTWHDGRIYFAAPDGTIGCLSAADGSSIWSVNPTKQFRGRGTDFGYSCSPVIADGKVIIPVGGMGASVVALSAVDGSVLWTAGDSSASYASALPITLNGQKQVITLLENSLAAFDLQTGKLLWEDEFSDGYDEHSAAPLYREPFLMYAGPFRSGAKCLRLPLVADEKPVSVWENQKFSNDIASSVLYEGRVYGFDLKDPQSRVQRPSRGEYRCLDFETGKILWSSAEPGHANTIIADGKLVLFNDRGQVILARAGTDQYEELARAQVFDDEICWSPPALDRGRLYLRTQTRAVCLYLGKSPPETSQPVQTIAAIPRSSHFDPTPLLGGEREFPATSPEWSEFALWHLVSVAAILVAGVFALLTWVFARLAASLRHRSSPEIPRGNAEGSNGRSGGSPLPGIVQCVYWSTILAAGSVGSPVLNRLQSEYIFLWPLVLWTALQLTVLSIVWAERQQNRRKARWVSRLAGLAMLATSGLYFHLCRKLGLSIEWGFLSSLLTGFPVAVLCAVFLQGRWRRMAAWGLVPCSLVSFSWYYWSGALFIKWWMRVGS